MFDNKKQLIKKMIDNDQKGINIKFFYNGLELGHDGDDNLVTTTGFKNGIKEVNFVDIKRHISTK